MKRNNLKWAAPMAALCLLTAACSKDNDPAQTDGKTRLLTIGCGIGEAVSKPRSRAGILPDNSDQSKEKFIWHKDDAFAAWLIPGEGTDYDATAKTFTMKEGYSDDAPSKSAIFECTHFPNNENSYKMLAVYPKANFTLADNAFTVSVPFPQTQTGKNNTRHLASSMSMYALATIDKGSEVPGLTFHHLTALLRFTVTNKKTSACRIIRILLQEEAYNPIFGSTSSLQVTDWAQGTVAINYYKQGTAAPSLLLKESSTDEGGIQLSAGSATDNSNVFDAYISISPAASDLSASKIRFDIDVTATDGSNQRSYTSMALDCSKIIAANGGVTTWEPGKRYWFDLVLDNELTVTLKEVTPMPGWDDETDL